MTRWRAGRAAATVGIVSISIVSAGIVSGGIVSIGPLASTASAHAGAPAPITALPSAAKPSSLQYVVADGDYLWGIAVKLGVKLDDLLAVNAFTVASVIHPGQALVVPEGGALPAAAAAPVVAPPAPYVVVVDDSLIGVAGKLHVKLSELLTTNTLTTASVIYPGTQLIVPAGGTLPTVTAPAAASVQSAATARSSTAAAQSAAVAATGTAASAATSAAATNTTYSVQAGDYLVGIAAKNGVTLKALLAANDLITTSSIFPGRELSVPPATLPIPAPVDGVATAAGATGNATPTTYQQSINTLLTFLQAQLGKPYAFNTAGPETYDCSGLVTAAFDQIGINLPHQSLLQSRKGTAVNWLTDSLLPGDLVFQFSSANPGVIGHVGIVIDSTHWIQAAGSGTPVRIGPLPSVSKIQAVQRIVQP